MNECDEFTRRFTSSGQDNGIKELRGHELEEYQLILSDLVTKHIDSSGEISEGSDIQVINKIVTPNDENITPMGLVNVSLEYLAKILTFARSHGIQWQAESRNYTDTHFKKLSHFKITVDCNKDSFVTMAKGIGFRY